MVFFTFKLINLGFWYYGTENGDSCYCGHNADRFVPASPSVCSMPCSGDANTSCGSAYRMNAYGPIETGPIILFEPNQVMRSDQMLYVNWQIDISFKIDAQLETRSNIYGLQWADKPFDDPQSQIPAVFVKPNSTELEICTKMTKKLYVKISKK